MKVTILFSISKKWGIIPALRCVRLALTCQCGSEESQRTLLPHVLKRHADLKMQRHRAVSVTLLVWSSFTQSIGSSVSILTCDVEIRDWSWRAVRSEDDTLAGAPRWSRMLTFLSLSAREIARGDVLPKSIFGTTLPNHTRRNNLKKYCINSCERLGQRTHQTAGLVRLDWRWPAPARSSLCWQHQRSAPEEGRERQSPGGLLQSSHLFPHPSFSPVPHPQMFDWHPGRYKQAHYSC